MTSVRINASQIMNSAMILLEELIEDNWRNVNSMTIQTKKIVAACEVCFSKEEVCFFVPPFEERTIGVSSSSDYGKDDSLVRIIQLRLVLASLIGFMEDKIGNPVADEILSDQTKQSLQLFYDDKQLCAASLARMALEQCIKQLCRMNGIDPGENKAASLNIELKKKSVYPDHMADELSAKLKILNSVVHGNQVPKGEVGAAISWIDKFISNQMSGKVDA